MKKSIQIFIVIDDVPLSELEGLVEQIEQVVEKYPDKRVQLTIQDEPMVRR